MILKMHRFVTFLQWGETGTVMKLPLLAKGALDTANITRTRIRITLAFSIFNKYRMLSHHRATFLLYEKI